MEIRVRAKIEHDVEFSVPVSDFMDALNSASPAEQWNTIAQIFNEFVPHETHMIEDNHYPVIKSFVKRLALKFKLLTP